MRQVLPRLYVNDTLFGLPIVTHRLEKRSAKKLFHSFQAVLARIHRSVILIHRCFRRATIDRPARCPFALFARTLTMFQRAPSVHAAWNHRFCRCRRGMSSFLLFRNRNFARKLDSLQSCVVPVKNGGDYFAACLDSLLEQVFDGRYEVLHFPISNRKARIRSLPVRFLDS